MPSPPSAIRSLAVDPPLVQSAGYRFDANDRAYIDDQIRGIEQHLVDLLITGILGTWYTLDSNSVAVVAGDNVCLSGSTVGTVTKAVAAALSGAGAVFGVVLVGAAPGAKVKLALDGAIPAAITGLAAGAPGPVRCNTTTARCEKVSSLSSADYPVGNVDNGGYLNVTRFSTGLVGAGTAGPAGGDLSGTYPNPTVAKINGSTVPVGGGLTVGQVLQVTGAAALGYAALNLALAASVTGALPIANIAPGSNGQVLTTSGGVPTWAANAASVTWAGDLAGSSNTSQVVSAISGTSPIPITPNVLQWVVGATPTLKQADNTTANATGATTTIQAQNTPTGASASGGILALTSGSAAAAGAAQAGVIFLQTGGTNQLSIQATGPHIVYNSGIQFRMGTGGASGSGVLRIAKAQTILTALNNAGAADLALLATDAADALYVGSTAAAGNPVANLNLEVATGGKISGVVNNVTQFAVDGSQSLITAQWPMAFGITPASTSGAWVRVPKNNIMVAARNNANTADVVGLGVAASDNLYVGSDGAFGNICANLNLSTATGGSITGYVAGVAVFASTSTAWTWGTNVVSSTYNADANVTHSIATVAHSDATNHSLTIQAQNNTGGGAAVGGALNLTSGTGNGAGNAGNVLLQTGGVTKLTVNQALITSAVAVSVQGTLSSTGNLTASGRVNVFGGNGTDTKVVAGPYPGAESTYACLWLLQPAVAAGVNNMSLLSDGSTLLFVNVPSGTGAVSITSNNATVMAKFDASAALTSFNQANVNFNGVATTTTAPAAGGAGALPATPTGYATIQFGGTARKVAYY